MTARQLAADSTGRSWWRGEHGVAVGCGVTGVVAGLVSILATQDGTLHPSALVNISSQDPLAGLVRASDPHFHFVTLNQHYDGAYYYAIARDPVLTGKAHTLIDQAPYRYGHPLHGWLAGLLSAGQARAVPVALLVLGLLGLAVGGWAASRLSVRAGRTPWGGLVLALSPGLLYAATVDTSETVGAALIALAFLAWLNERYRVAALLLVLVCLDREQYVTVPIGLAIWELVEARRRRQRPDQFTTKAVAVVVGPVALAAWFVYVRAKLHTWPLEHQAGNFGKPIAGWIKTFQLAHLLAGSGFTDSEIGTTTPAMLIATAVLLLIAVVVALRMRTIFDATLILMAVITSMQGWRTLLYPHEVLRTPAIAVLLALAVLLCRPRAEPPQGAANPAVVAG